MTNLGGFGGVKFFGRKKNAIFCVEIFRFFLILLAVHGLCFDYFLDRVVRGGGGKKIVVGIDIGCLSLENKL